MRYFSHGTQKQMLRIFTQNSPYNSKGAVKL